MTIGFDADVKSALKPTINGNKANATIWPGPMDNASSALDLMDDYDSLQTINETILSQLTRQYGPQADAPYMEKVLEFELTEENL